jgi:2-hydroxychromene-2-carboxylate isomerase
MKVTLGVALTQLLTSHGLRDVRRFIAGLPRRWQSKPAQLHYFHQLDDPYSHLLLQVLPGLLSHYRIALQVHLAPAPDASAAPERERLQAWSRRDAAQLAAHLGLNFTDPGAQPEAHLLTLAEQAMAAALGEADVLLRAATIGAAFWRSDMAALQALLVAVPSPSAGAALASGQALRVRLGHYLGAMLWFDGEWFWAVDRLPHLQRRLVELGLGLVANAPPVLPQREVQCRVKPRNGVRPQLHFYCSLRSPYTYLAVPRMRQLAEHYGAELCLRPVLPMAMRGLPVPLAKRLYIVRDCKREADRLGLPFGKIADPLGAPTERGLAVLFKAMQQGQDAPAFLESFMRGVFAEGIDAGSERGLFQLAQRAGLTPEWVQAALADDSWRVAAEANRSEMFALGLWGVPSFRVDQQPAQWGQDRLWLIERDLIAATALAG